MNLDAICLTCPHRSPPPYSGVMLCTLTGRDSALQREEKHCPAGRFKLGIGDTIARVTHAAGIKQCGGCKKRQMALNRKP